VTGKFKGSGRKGERMFTSGTEPSSWSERAIWEKRCSRRERRESAAEALYMKKGGIDTWNAFFGKRKDAGLLEKRKTDAVRYPEFSML